MSPLHHSWSYPTRNNPMAQSKCVCVCGGSGDGNLQRRQLDADLSIRKSRPQRFARPQLLLERLLHHQMVSAHRAGETAIRRPILQRVQPSQLRPPEHGAGRCSREAFHTNRLRCADVHNFSSDRFARSWIGRRQQSPDDCVSGTTTVLKTRPERRFVVADVSSATRALSALV